VFERSNVADKPYETFRLKPIQSTWSLQMFSLWQYLVSFTTGMLSVSRSRHSVVGIASGCTVQLKRDGTRWRTGGEVKGKLANGVSSITTADAHTSAASSRLDWRPCRFKWTRPFRRKTKSGFCACAITFQTQSTVRGSNLVGARNFPVL